VPIDTTIPLVLKNTINSRTAYVGQAIYCETIYPIAVGNRIVIPVGSYVKGSITEVKRAGHAKGRAEIGFRFDSITLPEGTTSSLRATLSGFNGTGKEDFKKNESKVQGQSSTGEKVGKVAEGAATGAEVGTIAGASRISETPTRNGGIRVGNSALAGLGIGAAAGAAGGLIWGLASRGKDIVLPAGTNLELQLSQPLTFDRYEVHPHSRYDEGPALPRRDYGPGL
jgi:type IV secretion system protein VirB10